MANIFTNIFAVSTQSLLKKPFAVSALSYPKNYTKEKQYPRANTYCTTLVTLPGYHKSFSNP